MNYNEFINTYKGKSTDYDGGYGVQCVDLIKLYLDKVFGIKAGAWGNAKDYWYNFNNLLIKNSFTKIANTPTFVPQKGDIVIWNGNLGNGNGHIAIATGEGTTSWFNSYDQNWGSKEMKLVTHTYQNFLGVLRPNDQNKINPSINVDIIDLDLYNVLYEDLNRAYKGNIEALKNHYDLWGKKEGRIASYIFDPVYYLNKYSDLKSYKNDNKGLYDHFITFGMKEGRQASQLFSVSYYIENSSDLKNMTNLEAVNHFLIFGINEARKTSPEFNVTKYKDNYPDLKNAFGNNYKAYYRHYLLNGKNERRKTI